MLYLMVHETFNGVDKMATIKDVAQLAGVSIGTVSNVLNGKTRNTDLIERVEKAMQELKYIPDETARSLKKEKTGLIGLILPNSVNPEYSSLLAEIEALLTQHGYSILLIFSHNNALLEKKAVEKCLKQRVDGIILYSPHRSSKQLEFAENQIPVVLISQKEDKHVKADTIILDYFPAFKAVMEYLKAIEKNNIAMIIDESFLQNEKVVDTYQDFWADQGIIVITDYSKEHGFRAAYELLYQKPEIDAIIAGNYLIAQGIKKASNVLKNRDLQIVVLKESNWIEDEQSFPVQITLSQKRIAELVVKRLLDAIDNPDTHEPIVKKVMAEYKETPSVFPDIDQTKKEIVLRFAMYESPTSTGIKLLSEIYMEHTGIKIKLDMYKYDELEKIAYQVSNQQIKDYDGIMMDITWIDDLVKKDFLMGLKNSGIHFDDFIEGIEQQLGFYRGNYYSVPIMSGTQLLFYQKDLFESDEIKRLFTRLYERELKVPSSWAEFNIVAEFFTRSFNSKSPTKYGVSKVTGENIYTTIDYGHTDQMCLIIKVRLLLTIVNP
jgi:DNA-binding LacI/PurR family transcriptional regulator